MTENQPLSIGDAAYPVEAACSEKQDVSLRGDESHEAVDAKKEKLLVDKELEPLDSIALANESVVNLLESSTEESSDVLVTISLSRLQQYAVDFCAQVIRDSNHLSIINTDLEHNGQDAEQMRAPTTVATAPRRLSASQPIFGTELSFSIEHIDEPSRIFIKETWDNVIPWEIAMLDLQVDEILDPTDLVRRCRSNLELHRIFISSEENISRAVLDASILAWYVNQSGQGSPESIMFGVVICCCLAARRGNITIGNVLKHCYGIGVLKQPVGNQVKDYLEHSLLVIKCAFAMNRIVNLEPLFGYTDGEWKSETCGQNRVIELLTTKKTLGELLGLDLVELFQVLHTMNYRQAPMESASGYSFRVNDLNTKDLRSIGRLNVEWTTIIENHLLLDLEKMTLSIVWSPQPREGSIVGGWQSMFLNRLPSRFLDGVCCKDGDRSGNLKEKLLNEELERSWAFLFGTSKKEKNRIAFYNRLASPPWAEDGAPEWMKEQQMRQPQSRSKLPRDRILMASIRNGLVPYTQFPIFETRIRQLRHYMNNQRPRGLRQLWIDKRDSANYYAFWGMITIGVVAILLALLSLVVGIAQAWASFQALDLATVQPSPNGEG